MNILEQIGAGHVVGDQFASERAFIRKAKRDDELAYLERTIAYEKCRNAILLHCELVAHNHEGNGSPWVDITCEHLPPDIRAGVARFTRLLELRGLLKVDVKDDGTVIARVLEDK